MNSHRNQNRMELKRKVLADAILFALMYQVGIEE
jgi:hypothetical protein